MINDLLLLSGNDIPFSEAQLIVHQPTLKEIAYIGEDSFFSGCEVLNFSKNLLPSKDRVNLENKTDFDIIMSPCIQLYNNYSTDDWEALCSHFEILKFAKPDYIHFKRLLRLLLKLSKSMKKENIHFIVSHEMIATYVDENIDDTISLINIDHHHDIAYVDKDIENKIEYLNCGNWVKYLSEKGKLENYVWIKNEDSTDYTEDIKFNLLSITIIE